jgi:hypothetical protein
MLHATYQAINAVLRIDPTINSLERARIMRRLEEKDAPPVVTPPAAKPKLIKRRQVAERLSCSVRTVDKMAAAGVLTKVLLPGRGRASGFREADLDLLISTGVISKDRLNESNACGRV